MHGLGFSSEFHEGEDDESCALDQWSVNFYILESKQELIMDKDWSGSCLPDRFVGYITSGQQLFDEQNFQHGGMGWRHHKLYFLFCIGINMIYPDKK